MQKTKELTERYANFGWDRQTNIFEAPGSYRAFWPPIQWGQTFVKWKLSFSFLKLFLSYLVEKASILDVKKKFNINLADWFFGTAQDKISNNEKVVYTQEFKFYWPPTSYKPKYMDNYVIQG